MTYDIDISYKQSSVSKSEAESKLMDFDDYISRAIGYEWLIDIIGYNIDGIFSGVQAVRAIVENSLSDSKITGYTRMKYY